LVENNIAKIWFPILKKFCEHFTTIKHHHTKVLISVTNYNKMSIIIMTKSKIINSDLLYIATYIVDTNNWLEIYLLRTYTSSHTCFYFIMQTESDCRKSNHNNRRYVTNQRHDDTASRLTKHTTYNNFNGTGKNLTIKNQMHFIKYL